MSRYEKYFSFDISEDSSLFEFVSVGPKGEIKIVVQFTPTKTKHVFNLGFGNLQNDGTIDDHIVNDNKDRDKILATVAEIVFYFLSQYPNLTIGFTGSTENRTRLYRMAITLNYSELEQSFIIMGLTDSGAIEIFHQKKSYKAFFVKLKQP
ncbi:MAG TPA: hypothetical protein VE978_16005 [Chitinophagales bacterium]|nr:hypothetical protein [Chitinophagales bacterium]